MSEYCFWILTDGMIVQPAEKHILAVVAAPLAFNETEDSLQETFKKYGQSHRSNFEGGAREEVLLRVIKRNHIRIRKNQFKRTQYWSLQLYRMSKERKDRMAAWASFITPMADDKFADVIIHQLSDGSRIRNSLDELANGYIGDAPEIINQDELLRLYG